MAIPGSALWEVQYAGSDTNGGCFAPLTVLNSDGAATSADTSAPVFTSATYSFTADDVGHYVFIRSGTNWIPGWYRIASVSGGAATLDAAVGTVNGYATKLQGLLSTVGCATTSSPTGATWTVDYSQAPTPIALTGMSTTATVTTVLCAQATKAMLGNIVNITGGTNFTAGRYQITVVNVGVSFTLDRVATTGAGSSGVGSLGGSLGSLGKASSVATVTGMQVFCKRDASTYLITSATVSVSGGCVTLATGVSYYGYDVNRTGQNYDNRPTIQIDTGVSSATIFGGNAASIVGNFILDGNNQTTSRGTGTRGAVWRVKAINFTNGGISDTVPGNATAVAVFCEVANCTGSGIGMAAIYCVSYGNSGYGFSNTSLCGCFYCIAYNNADGYNFRNAFGCVAYGNTGNGFRAPSDSSSSMFANCIAENNGGAGYQMASSAPTFLVNCADYNNTSGRIGTINQQLTDPTPIEGTASFFTNAAAYDFSLNDNAGGGALLRGLGFPSLSADGLTASASDVGAVQHPDVPDYVLNITRNIWMPEEANA